METLVVVAQHRNQYYSRGKGHGAVRYGSFDTPPSKDFRGINCRTFQSGSGLLPTPPPLRSLSPPVVKRAFSPSLSPKSPSSSSVSSRSEESKKSNKLTKSSAIPIPAKLKVDVDFGKLGSFNGELSFSERWAGPAYSNSPPPSSLPIPKFSIRPKRTVSLDLPSSASDIDFHPIAKSAPTSPTRERSPSPVDLFDDGVDSATKTLRRILNLDLTDE